MNCVNAAKLLKDNGHKDINNEKEHNTPLFKGYLQDHDTYY